MADAEEQNPETDAAYSPAEYAAYMEERKTLIEAARESAKTFDQAVLAFGSAIFGASIAFLKDVAPHPQHFTLKWLGAAWFLFSSGLLAALMSFIWSHKACMSEIDAASAALGKPNAQRPLNTWSALTDRCNYICIGLLFLGLSSWSVFALENLNQGGNTVTEQSPNQPLSRMKNSKKGTFHPKRPSATTIKSIGSHSDLSNAQKVGFMTKLSDTAPNIPVHSGYVPPRTPPPPPPPPSKKD